MWSHRVFPLLANPSPILFALLLFSAPLQLPRGASAQIQTAPGTDPDPPCAQRYFPATAGWTCVCNATYCDAVPDPPAEGSLDPQHALLYVSSKSGKRFRLSTLSFHRSPGANSAEQQVRVTDAKLTLDPSRLQQQVFGFGGAFTDAAAINADALSDAARARLLESYFHQNRGIAYTMGRVPMASCDFSTHVYSYCDSCTGDLTLGNFSLTEEDTKYKIPMILDAIKLVEQGSSDGGNASLNLFASPWSAPGWMKDSGQMQGGGQLKGDTNGPYYQAWAKYFERFFEEYAASGVRFWGVTVENEPSSGLIPNYPFQAMYLSAEQQRDFVKTLLGPQLKGANASESTQNLKLMVNDDNRMWLPYVPDIVFADDEASKYVDGVGVHWYSNGLFSVDRLTTTHQRHPTKFILPTEASNGVRVWPWQPQGPAYGDWSRAEAYAQDIIENLQNWAVGWVDWNLALDIHGGPNWVNNFADAAILVNSTADEFLRQPMFYALGHFSKFIRPGSHIVQTALKVSGWHPLGTGLFATAALGPGGRRLTVVLLNRDTGTDYRMTLMKPSATQQNFTESGPAFDSLDLVLERSSVATVIFDLPPPPSSSD